MALPLARIHPTKTAELRTPVHPHATRDDASVILRLEYGDTRDAVGCRGRSGARPTGPESLALAPGGVVTVLDPVNRRLLTLRPSGGGAVEVGLGGDTDQDLVHGPHGGVVLLDRIRRRSVRVVSSEGRVQREVPLVGSGIDRPGAVTGLFADPDGIWAEVRRRRSVRLLDASLRPDPDRTSAFGRPVGGGRFAVLSQRVSRCRVALALRECEHEGEMRVVVAEFGGGVEDVLFAARRSGGALVVAAAVSDRRGRRTEVVHLEAEGTPRARLEGPAAPARRMPFRSFALSPSGALHQLVPGDDGVEVMRWIG